jgi:stringent starvation protein B
MTDASLTSRRPYLLRAMHEWITDNGQTPHIVVDAAMEGVKVPPQHVKDGKIILNVSLSAAQGLSLGNEELSFRARFGGVSQDIVVPVAAVVGIYARESGQGMIFGDGEGPAGTPKPPSPQPPLSTPPSPPAGVPRKSHLKVVK